MGQMGQSGSPSDNHDFLFFVFIASFIYFVVCAAKQSPEVSLFTKIKQLHCPVCIEIHPIENMSFLICAHPFCNVCLQKLQYWEFELECPVCRHVSWFCAKKTAAAACFQQNKIESVLLIIKKSYNVIRYWPVWLTNIYIYI